MKKLIFMLHLVSGNTIEISDPFSVSNLNMSLITHSGTMCGEFSCVVDGCKMHINMTKVEYITEKIIDVTPEKDTINGIEIVI